MFNRADNLYLDLEFFWPSEEFYCRLLVSYDNAVLGQSLRRVHYEAVALCSLSCAQMKATNPTMKGAATPVSIRQVEAAHPHLIRLPIDSASASPTSRPRRATLSYPPRRQATSWSPL